MAALAHGRPVLGLLGSNTDDVLSAAEDALVLTRVGDRQGYANAAAELAADPLRLQSVGEAGRRLYEDRFDWPRLARNVAHRLEAMAAQPQVGEHP